MHFVRVAEGRLPKTNQFRVTITGDSTQFMKALRDVELACLRMLYLIALERLARVVESLKRAGERVSAGGM